jgi:hydrogenase maturation factor
MSEKPGKLEEKLLGSYITSHCGKTGKDVLVKPGFGIDVGIVELPGGQAMALTSDPLSLIPTLGLQESAWLSVQLMANDMATTGFAPQYGQFVLNLPATLSEADLKTYWQYIHTYCKELGTSITGGHTGFVEGQNSTIAGGGTFISIGPKEQMLATPMAGAGDCLLLTKSAAISSAAILAMSFPKTVIKKLGNEIYKEAEASFYYTSSVKDALAAKGASDANSVTAMHDVTEGGVLGAIYEMASAANCGAIINDEQIPVGFVQEEVCRLFSLDPKRCIGAGAMLISCKNDQAARVIARLRDENIDCTEIGQLLEANQGIKYNKNGEKIPLSYQTADPYWAAFYKAYKNGWQ